MDVVAVDKSILEAVLAAWPDSFAAVADQARASVAKGLCMEMPGNVLLIGHQPERGRLAFVIRLFPPRSSDEIDRYEASVGIRVPTQTRDLLAAVNGFSFYELEVYGVPPSMLAQPPLLDRSALQPLDIGAAQRMRKASFPCLDADFLFACRNVGWDRQIGYFLRPGGSVIGYWRLAEPGADIVGSWDSIAEWISVEPLATMAFTEAHAAEVAHCSAALARRRTAPMLALFGRLRRLVERAR